MPRTPSSSNKADAKERLLQTAIRVFAQYGFHGTSTRQLAKEANVNISAIPYYFESKDGLYEAVVNHILTLARTHNAENAERIRQALDNADELSMTQARTLLHTFIRGFAGFLLSNSVSPYFGQIIIREQLMPTNVFNIIYEEGMRPLHTILTRLVAHMTGMKPDSAEAIICTHTLLGQIVVFKTHKELIRRRLGIEKDSNGFSGQVEPIIGLILKNTDAVIAAHTQGDLS